MCGEGVKKKACMQVIFDRFICLFCSRLVVPMWGQVTLANWSSGSISANSLGVYFRPSSLPTYHLLPTSAILLVHCRLLLASSSPACW